MVKKSIIYYVKCIIMSIIGYVCGGFIFSFLLTEIESSFSLFIPIIISILGIILRIKILKRQIKKEGNFDFNLASFFKMGIPAFCLLFITLIILLFEIYVDNTGVLMYHSIFDNIKMFVWILFPGALTVDGIIYNLSYWNNAVYYVLLIANILIYILPVWIYMACLARTQGDGSSVFDDSNN